MFAVCGSEGVWSVVIDLCRLHPRGRSGARVCRLVRAASDHPGDLFLSVGIAGGFGGAAACRQGAGAGRGWEGSRQHPLLRPFRRYGGGGIHRGGEGAAADRRGYLRDHIARHLAEWRSAENTSELQSLMRISYAVLCLKKKQTETSYKQ